MVKYVRAYASFGAMALTIGFLWNLRYRHVENSTFPIFATGVYFDQNTHRGQKPGTFPPNSTSTHIMNFTWVNVTGTINSNHPGDGSYVVYQIYETGC